MTCLKLHAAMKERFDVNLGGGLEVTKPVEPFGLRTRPNLFVSI